MTQFVENVSTIWIILLKAIDRSDFGIEWHLIGSFRLQKSRSKAFVANYNCGKARGHVNGLAISVKSFVFREFPQFSIRNNRKFWFGNFSNIILEFFRMLTSMNYPNISSKYVLEF